MEIATPDTLQLKVNSAIIPCIPSSTGSCNYSTSATSGLPVVTAVSKVSDDTLKFEGTGFETLTDFSGKARYLKVEAASVDVESDTLALATFS